MAYRAIRLDGVVGLLYRSLSFTIAALLLVFAGVLLFANSWGSMPNACSTLGTISK
jgi:hypothetical protein